MAEMAASEGSPESQRPWSETCDLDQLVQLQVLSQERTRKGRGKSNFSSSTVSGDPDETHWDTAPAPEPTRRTLRKRRGRQRERGVKFHVVSSLSNPDCCEFGLGIPSGH